MTKTHQFTHHSFIKTSLDRLVAFHRAPAAFEQLAPPPMRVTLQRDDRNSLTDGEMEFTMHLGPLAIPWLARHEPGPTAHSFADSQINGPMASWRHVHLFEEQGPGVMLKDQITYTYPPGLRGLLTYLLFNPLSLKLLFYYRHWVTRKATRTLDIQANPGARA